MENVANILIFLALVLLGLWNAWRIAKAKWDRQEEMERSRRDVIKDGKKTSVVTVRRQLVREIRTGRRAIIVERGRENDPTTIKGQMDLVPRWIKVNYILKHGGFSYVSAWRRSNKFVFLDVIDVDHYE